MFSSLYFFLNLLPDDITWLNEQRLIFTSSVCWLVNIMGRMNCSYAELLFIFILSKKCCWSNIPVYSNWYSIERSRIKRSPIVSVRAFSHRFKLKLKRIIWMSGKNYVYRLLQGRFSSLLIINRIYGFKFSCINIHIRQT